MNERPIGRVRSLTEPPVAPEASAPTPPPPPRRTPDPADEINRALDVATTRGPARPAEPEVPLKRQWDNELEAELEAALEGFDASALDVTLPGRTRAADRAHVPGPGVGQEQRSGPQQAKVIGIKGQSVFLDLGAKSEGVVPVEQFADALPRPGDMIEVMFDRYDPSEGLLHMSLKGAAVEANWQNLRKGLVVEARVTKVNKGGLDVDVDGIRGFLPISQIDVNRVDDASTYLNQKLKVVVTEANPRERNLVVSRRDLLEQEREALREQTWTALEEGQVRAGVVRSVKDFGAFVDLGGVDGLIHVSDLSWVRTQDVGSVVKVGQQVQVKVLKIDRATSKISLGLKQLLPSPWETIEEKYAAGTTVRGKVTRLMDFGAFVELESGIEGLIHISELANQRVVRVKDIVKPEQEVEVRILKVEPEARRIALSLRPLPVAPEPAPEEPDDNTPPPPKPPRKVPLKGGLGDHDPNPFTVPPA